MSATDGNFGNQNLATGNNEYNQQLFVIKQLLGRLRTNTLVEVISVDSPVGVNPVGYLTVSPLVNQVDGGGTAIPHTNVYEVPYLRIQGGSNAVICDPQPGDIGFACFADSDISSVKKTRAEGNPGSKRTFSIADALYMGGWSKTPPQRYILVDDTGIIIEGMAKITMHGDDIAINASSIEGTATTITLNGKVKVNGDVEVSGKITASGDVVGGGISLDTHIHGGVMSGGAVTTGPQ